MTKAAQTEDDKLRVRLDKWLWAARFYKTRSLAKEAIEGGKVHYNQQRVKPGKVVELNALVKMRLGWDEKEVLILGIAEKRRSAPEAQLLYTETEASIAQRERRAWERKQNQIAQYPPARRPSKKERRQIHRFKDQHPEA